MEPHAPVHVSLQKLGHGFGSALADFKVRWASGFSGSADLRYLGFVTGGATPASLAGDWLTRVFDQNPTSGLDSTAPDLERETCQSVRTESRPSGPQPFFPALRTRACIRLCPY